MLESVGKIHTGGRTRLKAAGRRLAKPSPAPVARKNKPPIFTCALPFPTLSTAVPTKYEIRHDLRLTALCLQAFLDLGMVSEKDLVEPWESERDVLKRAFNRFVQEEGSDLALFSPLIVLADSVDSEFSDREETGKQVLFCFYKDTMEWLYIGNGASRLEEVVPGLGETFLYHVGRAVYSTLHCVTPESCLDIAKYIYWQGEDDEREVIAEMEANGEDPKDYDGYRKKDYFNHIPEWAASPANKLSPVQLANIAKEGNGIVREAAEIALALAEQLVDGYEPPSFEEYVGGNIDPALFARWSEDDDVERVYDDYYQYMTQAECTEMHGYLSATPDKEGIGKALDNIRQFFRILKPLDRAFCLIGERIGEGS